MWFLFFWCWPNEYYWKPGNSDRNSQYFKKLQTNFDYSLHSFSRDEIHPWRRYFKMFFFQFWKFQTKNEQENVFLHWNYARNLFQTTCFRLKVIGGKWRNKKTSTNFALTFKKGSTEYSNVHWESKVYWNDQLSKKSVKSHLVRFVFLIHT